uniref:Probable G-protein coupled receptor 33 n=1 Tax=Varanus komodoensis TaxID=61221 RepID=A0A8D2KUR8_VARKO
VRSSTPVGALTLLNQALGVFMLVSFLVGITLNGLLLWLLWAKMDRTVNILWFLHLTLSYLISCCCLPFFGISTFYSQWVFDNFSCKLGNFSITMAMFTTVYLLTIISLDRYLLICHPMWSQRHRTIPRVRWIIAAVWVTSLFLSSPYLAFASIKTVKGSKVHCVIDYALISNWDKHAVYLSFFVIRSLLAFLIPFFIIMGCYCLMCKEIKKKRLMKNEKPFRVLLAAILSFFIFRSPYYIYAGSCLLKAPMNLQASLWMVFIIGICLNICFTPVLYLFVGQKFQQVFKTSIIVLLRKGFTENPIWSRQESSTVNKSKESKNSSCLEPLSPLPSP